MFCAQFFFKFIKYQKLLNNCIEVQYFPSEMSRRRSRKWHEKTQVLELMNLVTFHLRCGRPQPCGHSKDLMCDRLITRWRHKALILYTDTYTLFANDFLLE